MTKSDKCKTCPCEDLCDAGLPPPNGCPKPVENKDFFTEFFNDITRGKHGS